MEIEESNCALFQDMTFSLFVFNFTPARNSTLGVGGKFIHCLKMQLNLVSNTLMKSPSVKGA